MLRSLMTYRRLYVCLWFIMVRFVVSGMFFCHDPGVSKDGGRNGSCCSCFDILQFSCNQGHELTGHMGIQCLPTGEWTSERPLCRSLDGHCPFPPAISHAVVKGSKTGDFYLPYDEVEVICEPGYSYRGISEFILCEESGEWEMEFGECTETFCDLPEPLANGTILQLQSTNLTSFPIHFELTYICRKGFRLVEGDSWRFCRTSGWSGRTPHCEVVRCPDPGVPAHGTRVGNNFSVGAKVYFKCFTGYYVIGSFERYCMPNGQWTGQLTRCNTQNNYCPDPGIPINAFKNSSSYDRGDIVGFRCRPGYIQLGSEVRECLLNRLWSGTETKCLGSYDYDAKSQISATLTAMVNVRAAKAAEEERKMTEPYHQFHSGLPGQRDFSDFISRQTPFAYYHPVPLVLIIRRLILYFLFDMSGSVGEANLNRSIQFAKAIVRKIGISRHGARAGALTFSSEAKIQFLPMDFNNTEQVLDAFDEIKYSGGGTSTSSALFAVREVAIPQTENHSENMGQYPEREIRLKSIIFLLTDGRANMGGNPEEEANKLKESGVEIYCIGITGSIKWGSLHKIASDSTDEPFVFILKNYASFSDVVQDIVNGTIDYSRCGLGLEAVSLQVAGGDRATKPWPWMAAIYFDPYRSINYYRPQIHCGGSVIHPNFILTAAHCLYDKKWNLRKEDHTVVILGLSVESSGEPTCLSCRIHSVKKILIHSKYKPGNDYDYDIALIQLKYQIEYTAYIRPVCLPSRDLSANSTLYKDSEYGLAIGWGHQGIVSPDEDDVEYEVSDHLKELHLPIQSRITCNQSVEDQKIYRTYLKDFTDRMFCAGDGQEGNDACSGDSGGPFMQSQLNNEGYLHWTQVGIISWGIGCGLANTYGYYTHVQQLRGWIDKTIEDALVEDV